MKIKLVPASPLGRKIVLGAYTLLFLSALVYFYPPRGWNKHAAAKVASAPAADSGERVETTGDPDGT